MDLTDVTTETLMAEVKRRLDCQTKPEKRVILVGAAYTLLRSFIGRSAGVCSACAARVRCAWRVQLDRCLPCRTQAG